MKRSEMVYIIMQGALNYNPTDPISYHQAKCILEAIEEAGMFPPEHLFTSGEKADHYLQEWESE
jgi:hypothetical protein